jgi:glycosyltransferase involved in cell wall biosynthesis
MYYFSNVRFIMNLFVEFIELINMDKSITFLVSSSGEGPIGGLRIIYEYANRLADRGWHVAIVHPAILWPKFADLSFLKKIQILIRFCRSAISKQFLPSKWMKLHDKISMLWALTLDEKYIPDADYVVACPVESTFYAENYSIKKGEKIYFIQGYENWNVGDKKLLESWQMQFKKITVAKWLGDRINEKCNSKCIVIPNGIDTKCFYVERPFNKRHPYSICFIYHNLNIKGSIYALSAINILKSKFPNLSITVFSAIPPEIPLPVYLKIDINPSQAQIRHHYNNTKVFISPSLSEGWPLPPAEAMLCGCVVVATDISGHREYIEEERTGFFCKPSSGESIAEKVEYIFNNEKIAAKISEQASVSLKEFDWVSRTDLFENALIGIH